LKALSSKVFSAGWLRCRFIVVSLPMDLLLNLYRGNYKHLINKSHHCMVLEYAERICRMTRILSATLLVIPHILNTQRTAYSKGWVKIANLENTYEQTEISQACERSK
jgi:hypothetical protein